MQFRFIISNPLNRAVEIISWSLCGASKEVSAPSEPRSVKKVSHFKVRRVSGFCYTTCKPLGNKLAGRCETKMQRATVG